MRHVDQTKHMRHSAQCLPCGNCSRSEGHSYSLDSISSALLYLSFNSSQCYEKISNLWESWKHFTVTIMYPLTRFYWEQVTILAVIASLPSP